MTKEDAYEVKGIFFSFKKIAEIELTVYKFQTTSPN